MSNISRKLLMEILVCGEMRNIRDQARENVLYSSEVSNLCNMLQEVLQSKDPQQSLLAEKYCIVFQRNYTKKLKPLKTQ